MLDLWMICAAAASLAAGTYVFRWVGPALPARFTESPRAKQVVDDSAILLLTGVMATTTLLQHHGFAGWARVLGVGTAGVLAWFRAPLLVVIIAAAAVTALARAMFGPA
jgi:Branched-chain amino acid transport protein (AzlD)